ncbi:MAG TPA: SprT-like domain-containing protein [Polyangiaceae bacterium LLY-WYZ-14_1]|nr:SprT-like domain-containing protein [Polyangiaceae bacterium LLY-WYZ-14_1]
MARGQAHTTKTTAQTTASRRARGTRGAGPVDALDPASRSLRLREAKVAPALRRTPVVSPRQLTLTFASGAPDLYVHEGMRQSLERRLGGIMGERIHLSITDNRRTMVSSQRRVGLLHVRLHHMFLDADDPTVRALGLYLHRGDRESSAVVGSYIERNGARIRTGRRRGLRLRARGEIYDLDEIYAELNRDVFGGMVDGVRVSWGRRGAPAAGRRRRRSIRLGTYCAEERLIRLHPVLDQPWVPRFFVAYIVFHEMLHHVVPAVVENGRHQFHPPEFRELERRYPDYDRAIRWEKRNLKRLLAS